MKGLRVVLKIVLVLILINVLIIGGYFIYLKNKNVEKKENEVLVVDQIDSFGYVLDNNKNDYYKSIFKELKSVLNEKEINYEEYAKSITKLFVTDLYTLSTKVSSSDVGGKEFVYKDFQKDFLSIAKTTLYKSVKSNIYGDRNQELPTVKNVTINEIKPTSFTYNKNNFKDSYLLKVSIEYEKDLGYQNSCEIILIRNENILQVAKLG